MFCKILISFLLFVTGELIANLIVFRYIKNYFDPSQNKSENQKKFLYLDISIFKGVLERFVLFVSLYFAYTPILVVFGALKLGTRLVDSKDRISNDYFLVGNFTSILIAILYTIILTKAFNHL